MVGQDLEQMILNHITDSAGFIIKSASAFDSEVFRHRDLHAFDMITVPERLQERVFETEKEHVMYWPLSQVMVDAKDCLLLEGAEQDPVEILCGGEIPAEGLFDDDTSSTIAARL